ncbi:helix-turn-helix transcriptional regulator [uncultured Microbacterium sp.]|uniref:helix-turn-helix transcriptional regulator n=1 Tax=uncultured Microbacterium sp. TaxID=191216 RepID=UPI002622428D|nr:helix-turn-helix transcriptional regulator [uncultured Microbacterium sp.]
MLHQEPDLTRLGAIFNDHRATSGLTYDELAEKSGLSRQTLLNLAAGRFNGDLRTWMLLAKAFDTSLDAMLDPAWSDHK